MTSVFRLGTIRGIPINLHWSLVLVFVLFTTSLALGFFPNEYPDLGETTVWVIAAIATVLLLFSILLHELGHAVIAQREGVGVRRITLFVFGGVAELQRDSPDGRAELRIAAAGPIVSVLLAVAFGVAGFATDAAGVDVIAAPAIYLARVNLLLAIFNLIPGFPLDGGRILRAFVWQRSGSRARADRVAGASGQVVALAFFGIGIFIAFGGNLLSGLWIIAIGWFIQNAAVANTQQSSLQELLGGVTASQAMHDHITSVGSRMMLRQVIEERVLGQGERFFIVQDDPSPRGIVSLSDIVRIPRERWDWVPAVQVMVPWSKVVTVEPNTPLLDALGMMSERSIAQVPVVDHGQIVGMLSREMVIYNIRLRSQLQGAAALTPVVADQPRGVKVANG